MPLTTEILCKSDLHVHTNLSFCSPQTVTAESYLALCEADGIQTIGFSNHIYKPEILQTEYPANVRFALRLQEELAALQGKYPVKVLLGCEVEMFYGQQPTLLPEDAAAFDYILLAASHIYNQVHEYAHMNLSTPEAARTLFLKQFHRACLMEYGKPTGICHPLYPVSCPFEQEVVDGITDSQLEECFTLAASHEKSIEIHASLFRPGTARDQDGLSPAYLRFLEAAKSCGCKFHFGSDSHTPEGFSQAHRKLELAARRLGITETMLWEPARP